MKYEGLIQVDKSLVNKKWVEDKIAPVQTQVNTLKEDLIDEVSNREAADIGLQSNIDAIIPEQTGQLGKFLTTNGANVLWANVPEGIPTLKLSLSQITSFDDPIIATVTDEQIAIAQNYEFINLDATELDPAFNSGLIKYREDPDNIVLCSATYTFPGESVSEIIAIDININPITKMAEVHMNFNDLMTYVYGDEGQILRYEDGKWIADYIPDGVPKLMLSTSAMISDDPITIRLTDEECDILANNKFIDFNFDDYTNAGIACHFGIVKYKEDTFATVGTSHINTVYFDSTAKTVELDQVNIEPDYTYNPESPYAQSGFAVKQAIDTKQDNLVSGSNIKTINNNSILGSGNLDATPDEYIKRVEVSGRTLTLIPKNGSPIEFTTEGLVNSVNGQIGEVVLDAEDVGALPDTTTIPSKVSDLTNDTGFITNSALSDYATQSWVEDKEYATKSSLEGNYSTTAQMNEAINAHHDSSKQDTISDLNAIRSGAEAGSTAVQPDAISDMATNSSVNTKLADYPTTAQMNSAISTAVSGKLDVSMKGSNNGVAELGSDGKVPESQLPSYVDDVLEYANKASFPTTGESGKIYIALDKNMTYRWSGSTYVEVGSSLALGETASTAYAGSKGKANAEAISALNTAMAGKQATLTAGTGIKLINNVISYDEEEIASVDFVDATNSDTMNFIIQERDTEKAGREAGDNLLWDAVNEKQDTLTADNKLSTDYISGLAIVATSGDYADLTNKPTIPDISTKMDKENPTGTGSLSINRLDNSGVGENSVAVGNSCKASGDYSFAEGDCTVASGIASHAEGGSYVNSITCTTASGDYSHAEGGSTYASGDGAHAEGCATQASGDGAHAEGCATQASDNGAHAEGSYTKASGNGAHAEGSYTKASGNYSHAEGYETIASSNYQHVQGEYNVEDTLDIYADIIGNGIYDARKNIEATTWTGDKRLKGDVYVNCNDDSTGGTKLVKITDLSTVATSGSYNDLSNKPTIPTVNNATLTIQKNGANVASFTANSASNATANITVPTKTSELVNDSNFATESYVQSLIIGAMEASY